MELDEIQEVNDFIEHLNSYSSRLGKRNIHHQINKKNIIKKLVNIAYDELNEHIIRIDNPSEYKGRNLRMFLNNVLKEINEQKNNINKKQKYIIVLEINALIAIAIHMVNKALNINRRQSKLDIIDVFDKIKEAYSIEQHTMESESESEYDSDESDYESDESVDESDDESDDDNKYNNDITDEIFKNAKLDGKKEIYEYFNALSDGEKNRYVKRIKKINNSIDINEPTVFKIMNMKVDNKVKKQLLDTYVSIINKNTDEKQKLWFDTAMKIPFGKYTDIDLKGINDNKEFITSLSKCMNDAIHGHKEAKHLIIQIMAQGMRNTNLNGNVFAIYGPPGNGKTTLIKEGISKAMNKPFIFISLGGATDASFLEGHNYTYEGSKCGRIVDELIDKQCMDPIIYFDELDKVSDTEKGMEIINLLVHLTDPVQNGHFRDKYLHGIDIDLSRATIIFSFNDINKINPILLDRINVIQTKFLLENEKIFIGQAYLLPSILKDMGLGPKDIIINDGILQNIICKYTMEGGVRKLKKLLYFICREINLYNMKQKKLGNEDICFPYIVSKENVKYLLRNKNQREFDKIDNVNRVGFVNGLYYSTDGIGGLIPIQTRWNYSDKPLEIKMTGTLGDVMSESINVAFSIAWSLLTQEQQEKCKSYEKGIHIHCPDGSTPKDGPSAGTAITLALYSLMIDKPVKNKIAMTGEIDFSEKVKKIGGLEEKLNGAKQSGVNLVLISKENIKDLEKIKLRNPTLINKNFKVKPVDDIKEVIKICIK